MSCRIATRHLPIFDSVIHSRRAASADFDGYLFLTERSQSTSYFSNEDSCRECTAAMQRLAALFAGNGAHLLSRHGTTRSRATFIDQQRRSPTLPVEVIGGSERKFGDSAEVAPEMRKCTERHLDHARSGGVGRTGHSVTVRTTTQSVMQQTQNRPGEHSAADIALDIDPSAWPC